MTRHPQGGQDRSTSGLPLRRVVTASVVLLIVTSGALISAGYANDSLRQSPTLGYAWMSATMIVWLIIVIVVLVVMNRGPRGRR
jgi:hypothetical protein